MTRVLFIIFCALTFSLSAQVSEKDLAALRPDPAREQLFVKYLAVRHGGMDALMVWKSSNVLQYYRELWYFCESFYVRRNALPQGETLDEGMIDITRFDFDRKATEEVQVVLPGFRDVIILKPENKLLYHPQY